MGILSLEKCDHLFWLGRYTERTFTIIRTLSRYYDQMIDLDEFAYRIFLDCLGLPYIYGSREAFVSSYFYDADNQDSLVSQLTHAYDNAVVMREELTSDTLCYIQMALDELGQNDTEAPLLVFQYIVDDLFAFWGSADDNIQSEDCRNILKCGKYVERVDLYLRFHYSFREVEREVAKLKNRLQKAPLRYDQAVFEQVQAYLANEESFKQNKTRIQVLLGGMFA